MSSTITPNNGNKGGSKEETVARKVSELQKEGDKSLEYIAKLSGEGAYILSGLVEAVDDLEEIKTLMESLYPEKAEKLYRKLAKAHAFIDHLKINDIETSVSGSRELKGKKRNSSTIEELVMRQKNTNIETEPRKKENNVHKIDFGKKT